MAGDTAQIDSSISDNDSETKKEAEEGKLYWMAKVHDFLEMWQGSENLHATQKTSRAQNKQITDMGYISDTEETVKESWSAFKHDSVAGCKITEKSYSPLYLLQIDLPGGKIKVLHMYRIHRINHHPS